MRILLMMGLALACSAGMPADLFAQTAAAERTLGNLRVALQGEVTASHRYDLYAAIAPFRRCLRCNGVLRPVDGDEIRAQLPPGASQYYQEFHRCVDCGQVYWPGSHYQRMRHFVDGVMRQEES